MIVHAYYLKDARVRRYAEFLSQEGHEIDVICLNEGAETATERHLGVNIYRIALGRRRGGQLSYLIEYMASFVRLYLKLRRLSRKHGHYDILHVHNMPDFLVFCGVGQKRLGTKIILDVHDLMPEVYQSKYALTAGHWLSRLLCLQERVSVRFASAVIAANHAFADILVERGVAREKVTVVMNAANAKFFLADAERATFRAAKVEGDFHVMYVGTLAPRYGLEHAVSAVARLHREGQIPGLRFSVMPKIANEGNYLNKIVLKAQQSGLGERFRLLNAVPHDAMPGVLAEADALIYTPLPDVHMDIALSLKIPEAIAVGCPVVAPRLSVNLRYFGEEALFAFDPGNTDECAARLLEIYTDPSLTKKKIAKARERLDEIAWTKQEKVYARLLDELYAGRHTGR